MVFISAHEFSSIHPSDSLPSPAGHGVKKQLHGVCLNHDKWSSQSLISSLQSVLNQTKLACTKAEFSHLGARGELEALPTGQSLSRKRSLLTTGCRSTKHVPWGETGNICQSSGSAFCHKPLQGSPPGLECPPLCALLNSPIRLPEGSCLVGSLASTKEQGDEEILYLLPDWLPFKQQQPCGVVWKCLHLLAFAHFHLSLQKKPRTCIFLVMPFPYLDGTSLKKILQTFKVKLMLVTAIYAEGSTRNSQKTSNSQRN